MKTRRRPSLSTRRPVLSNLFGILMRILTPHSLYVPPEAHVIIITCSMVRSMCELFSDDDQLTSSVKLSHDFSHMQHVINLADGTESQCIIARGTEYDIMKRVSIVNRKSHRVQSYGGSSGYAVGHLQEPTHLFIDEDKIYVVDRSNARKICLSQNLQYIGEDMSPDMLPRTTCLFTGTFRKCMCVEGSDRTVIGRQDNFLYISLFILCVLHSFK